jgi:DNA-directed RNA polymerase subunit beta
LVNRDGNRIVGSSGKAKMFDGRSGELLPDPTAIGRIYISLNSPSTTDPRSVDWPVLMITCRSVVRRSSAASASARWMLGDAGHGAAYAQELLTIKSTTARPGQVYEAILGENIRAWHS